jgi:hypothetical protein
LLKAVYIILLFVLLGCSHEELKLIGTLLSGTNDAVRPYNNHLKKNLNGYPFDALINGIPVLEMSEVEKKSISALQDYIDIDSVHWKLLKPIKAYQPINIEVRRHRVKKYDLGEVKANSFSTNYHNLSSKDNKFVKIKGINYDENLSNIKNLTMEENSSLVSEKVKQIAIVGEYVLSLTVKGTKDWSRKEIYFKVEEDSNESSFL